MRAFDWRRLFPLTYGFYKDRGDFNAFMFLMDVYIWCFIVTIIGIFIYVLTQINV
jgi:hypothetical protein